MSPKVAVIDNFDSFVYVLVQYLGELGAEVDVIRNNRPVAELNELNPDALLISPGPGKPADAGLSNEAIKYYAGRIPILGVCLGHQCIAEIYGSIVASAPELMHGKTSQIHHTGTGLFKAIPSHFTATRYHSLAVQPESITNSLEVTATTEDGVIMGIRHTEYEIEGVQFHPESVLTEHGHDLIRNFLAKI